MKRKPMNLSWVIPACLLFWVITLLALVSPSFGGDSDTIFAVLPLSLMIAVLLTFASIFVLLSGLTTRSPKNDRFAHGIAAKTLAAGIVLAVIVSTGTAVRSLWFGPFGADFSDRFVYENIATGAGFAGIALTMLLSAVQKDIYWVTRRKTVALDERQLQERRQVFETSYKLAAFIVVACAYWLNSTLYNVPTIIANHNGTVPGHLYWIGVNLALMLFALPLIVAAYSGQSRKKA